MGTIEFLETPVAEVASQREAVLVAVDFSPRI